MAFRNVFAFAAFGFFLAYPGVAPLHAAEPAALTQAVLAGDAAQVRAALAAGGSPGAVDPEVGHSVLYLAVAEGGPRDAAILDLLLARKPDLDAEDAQSKSTPLTACTGFLPPVKVTWSCLISKKQSLTGAVLMPPPVGLRLTKPVPGRGRCPPHASNTPPVGPGRCRRAPAIVGCTRLGHGHSAGESGNPRAG